MILHQSLQELLSGSKKLYIRSENKFERKSLRTRSESTAIEKGKIAYLEIYANLQQCKAYFHITTKEGEDKNLFFRMRDIELGHKVKGGHTTIATHPYHFLSFIGKGTKLQELERTDLITICPQPPSPNQKDDREKL